MLDISMNQLQMMFERYIDKLNRESINKYDTLTRCGEVAEATKWLELFGVDLSYERIEPMLTGEAPIKVFDDDTYVDDVWYTETWTDDDLVEAMEAEGVEINQENFDRLMDACIDMFEDIDLSDRNEMISNKVRELFC